MYLSQRLALAFLLRVAESAPPLPLRKSGPNSLALRYSRRCQSTINPVDKAVVDSSDGGGVVGASGCESTAIEGKRAGKNPAAYLAGAGNLCSWNWGCRLGAAARVAVAHTLESIGSGRFRSEVRGSTELHYSYRSNRLQSTFDKMRAGVGCRR